MKKLVSLPVDVIYNIFLTIKKLYELIRSIKKSKPEVKDDEAQKNG